MMTKRKTESAETDSLKKRRELLNEIFRLSHNQHEHFGYKKHINLSEVESSTINFKKRYSLFSKAGAFTDVEDNEDSLIRDVCRFFK
uniref:Uncharacterized protein n=1 Tax=Strongyloides venezuelensis TaxID=75913 RepID=A0A0K0F1B2_STRVS